MNFESYFPKLESFASSKMGDRDYASTTTDELAALLSLSRNEAVGAYEAYNRRDDGVFCFKRDFCTNQENKEWTVSIKKNKK